MNAGSNSGAESASTSSSSTASATAFETTSPSNGVGEDHLARLANLAQGVGKEESDSTATSTPNASDTTSLYPGYVPGYTGWPPYYQQFGQPSSLAPTSAAAAAAFGAWPSQWNGAAAAMSGWPAYAQSKKGRQTYQRYQTSVLEQKFLQSSYVSKKQREELRMQTNLTDRQIKIWFQNRRMKAKKYVQEKHRLEEGGEHSTLLPPTKGSLPLPHGTLPALPLQLQHLQQDGCSLDDKDKWQSAAAAHMAAAQHNPSLLAAHPFAGWPAAAASMQHPYSIPQYIQCPPNL